MTPTCAECGGPQDWARVEVTAYGDLSPRYLRAQPEPCAACGWRGEPVLMGPAPCLRATHGPVVPTPDDLLAGAVGLCLGAWR